MSMLFNSFIENIYKITFNAKIKAMNIQEATTSSTNNSLPHYSWIEIDKAAFLSNLKVVRSLIGPNCTFGFVAKANGYGHGLLQVSTLADQSEFVDYICVSSLSEALRLRDNGILKPILVLAFIDHPIELAISNKIDLVVYSLEYANQINLAAKNMGLIASVHLKIDTGLSRLGFVFESVNNWLTQIIKLESLSVVGAFTHFAESDNRTSDFTQLQIQRFEDTVLNLNKNGIFPKYLHCANSSGTTRLSTNDLSNPSKIELNFVRVGGLAYGLVKSKEIEKLIFDKTGQKLQQILSLKSKIIQIKEVKAGEYIGYSRTIQAEKNLTLVVIPIGYADGYPRNLSNKGLAYINGQQAKVIGRVSMNLTTLDITGIPANIGDIVELIGPKDGIFIKEIAAMVGTIDYEISTRLNLPSILS